MQAYRPNSPFYGGSAAAAGLLCRRTGTVSPSNPTYPVGKYDYIDSIRCSLPFVNRFSIIL